MATSTTILDQVNDVLPEIGLPTLPSLVGNTNQTALRTLALANREGRFLATHEWRILVKRHEITTASGGESYALPSDFKHFIDRTYWNDTNDEILWGPLSDIRWQADLSGLTTTYVNDTFQIRADGNENRLHIRPIPTGAETLTFFYVADSWIRSKGGTRQSEIKADTDVFLLDRMTFELGLKWRLLRAQRREWQTEFAEYEREKNKALARDGGNMPSRILGPVEDSNWPASGRVPETGFGS